MRVPKFKIGDQIMLTRYEAVTEETECGIVLLQEWCETLDTWDVWAIYFGDHFPTSPEEAKDGYVLRYLEDTLTKFHHLEKASE
jgi:hypothetical protein